MYQLYLCNKNEPVIISKIDFTDQEKTRFLALGFTEGTEITIISKVGKNFIVSVRGSRYGILESDAKKIYVENKKEFKLVREKSN